MARWRGLKTVSGETFVDQDSQMGKAKRLGLPVRGPASVFASYQPPSEPPPMPEPADLFGGSLTGEPKLTREMLPRVIADFAFDTAERMGVDPAMIAIPALAVCAAALHDGITIQPRVHDTKWTESARLWLAMVAEPGSRKTPAINAATRPLREIEGRWQQEDAASFAVFERASEDYKAARRGRSETIKDVGAVIADGIPRASLPNLPTKPARRRLTVGDATMEVLAHILADNDRGVLALHDELVAMIAGFDAYRSNGIGKDRTAALELWNGGPRTIDRVKLGGSVFVPNWSASVLGGIQPAKLREIASKLDSDGFLQRFQPFEGKTLGPGQDRPPDQEAIGSYAAVVRQLLDFRPPVPRKAITLSAEAHVERREVEGIAEALINLPSTPPALRSHMAKWPGMFARLLLTLHAIECASTQRSIAGLEDVLDASDFEVRQHLGPEVRGTTAVQARDLSLRFFLPNAIIFYDQFFRSNDPEGAHVRWIAGYILARGLARISIRDIKQAYRELESDDDGIFRAMRVLQAASWVGELVEAQRNSTHWLVNHRVHVRFAEQATAERQHRALQRARIAQSVERLRDLQGSKGPKRASGDKIRPI